MRIGLIRLAAAAVSGLCLAAAPVVAWGAQERPASADAAGRTVLRVGVLPVESLDPHFAASPAEIQVQAQIYEQLTGIDASGRPVPGLAVGWESGDGRAWTFFLRESPRFSDGRPLTAADVVWTFDRLRDPEAAMPALPLFGNILEVSALSRTRVRFLLSEPNMEFASDVADYHAAIVPAGSRAPGSKIGSGPFMFAYHFPGSRIILKRNPYYDLRSAEGGQLPRLSEIHFIFSRDLDLLVGALERGEIAYLGGLTARALNRLRSASRVRIATVDANMHWVIRMRTDQGRPAGDNRVRRALKLATNHQALIDGARPRLASIGNGYTPVGPAFGRYHLVRPPFADLKKARSLLAEAGYADGLAIELTVPQREEAISIATIWKKQVARIGVDARLQVVPAESYYGGGPGSWLEADWGITDWGARPTASSYFKLAYTADAPWNETRWSDPELEAIVRRIDREVDETNATRLYHRAQEILIERGPIIVAYFEKAAAGIGVDLQGVSVASDWPRTSFRDAWFVR